MTSLKTSLRNTGWSRHTRKINYLSLLLTSLCKPLNDCERQQWAPLRDAIIKSQFFVVPSFLGGCCEADCFHGQNDQNDRLYSKGKNSEISPEPLYHMRSRFLKKLMVKHKSFLELKTDMFFINPQKTEVEQNCCTDLLKTSLLPECHRLYLGKRSSCIMTGPSHCAKAMQQFLQQNTPDFIAADERASYSPALNHLD